MSAIPAVRTLVRERLERHPRRVGALAAALCTALLATPAAGAQLRMHPCFSTGRLQCGTVTVALDRSGAVRGVISLHVERLPANRPTEPPLFLLSGGPGQAAHDATDAVGVLLKTALRHRDLVVFDQRGTGFSGALNCRALERADPNHPGGAPSACAAALGRRRSLYTTADSVADIDAVRAAMGYARLTLFGVSYGTKVALAYAHTYPQRLERLIIDSVVTPDGPDPLSRSSFRTIPRLLRNLCGRSCSAVTRDPVGDLSTLVARMSRADLSGRVYDSNGHAHPAHLNGNGLFQTIFNGDVDPTLRGELPADVRAAVLGDPAPLLRLAARARPPLTGTPVPTLFSATLFTATTCEELPFPWSPNATPGQRLVEARQQVGSIPANAFAPFDAVTALSRELMTLCRTWPGAGERFRPATGPLPDVPALVISGPQDVRTPLEDSLSIAAQLPHARRLVVPWIGHSVVGSDESGCAARQVARFLQLQPTDGCPGPSRTPITPLPPRAVSGLAPLPGIHGARGRAARAVLLTAQDTITSASQLPFGRGGGLRGGGFRFRAAELTLESVIYIPRVKVTGSVNILKATAILRFSGAAGNGTLNIGHGRVSGTISGHRVQGRGRLLIPGRGQGAGGGLGTGPTGPWPVT